MPFANKEVVLPHQCIGIQLVMVITPNSRTRKGDKVKGEHGGIRVEEKMYAYYWGMVQSSQQHIAPCVKRIEWGLGIRSLRMVAAVLAGIPVQVTREAGVPPPLWS